MSCNGEQVNNRLQRSLPFMLLNYRQRNAISYGLICGARQAEAVLREFPLSSGTVSFMGTFFQIYLRLFIYGIQMWVRSEVGSRYRHAAMFIANVLSE
jgi:hypothetical protein